MHVPDGDARCARHRPGDEVSLDRRQGRKSVAPAAGPAGARSPDPRGTPGGRLGPTRREGRSGDGIDRGFEIPVGGAPTHADGYLDATSDGPTAEPESHHGSVCPPVPEKIETPAAVGRESATRAGA